MSNCEEKEQWDGRGHVGRRSRLGQDWQARQLLCGNLSQLFRISDEHFSILFRSERTCELAGTYWEYSEWNVSPLNLDSWRKKMPPASLVSCSPSHLLLTLHISCPLVWCHPSYNAYASKNLIIYQETSNSHLALSMCLVLTRQNTSSKPCLWRRAAEGKVENSWLCPAPPRERMYFLWYHFIN